MIEFVEISKIDDANFAEAMEIYSRAFPQSERHPVEVITERVRQGLSKLHVGRIKNEVVFIALLWPLKNTDFVLLDYMATKETHQNEGIGSTFMKSILEVLVQKKKHFIIEVENSKDGVNREQRRRRVSFYRRSGAKEMKNVRYVLPALGEGDATEMVLMIFPEYNGGIIDEETARNVVSQIYHELYGRDTKDVLLNSLISTIKGPIELI